MRISFEMIKKLLKPSRDVAKTLNISKNPYLISETSQTDSVIQSLEKLSKHPNIINIKNRISN